MMEGIVVRAIYCINWRDVSYFVCIMPLHLAWASSFSLLVPSSCIILDILILDGIYHTSYFNGVSGGNLPPSIAWSIQHGVFALNARHQLARPDVLGRAELLSFPKNCTRLVARTAIEQPRKVELTEFSRRSPFTTYQNLKWSTFSTSPVQRKRNRSYQFSRFQQKGFDLPCRFPAVLLPFSA